MAAVAALQEQANRCDDAAVCRLGGALLRELEWRASWGAGAAPALCGLPDSICITSAGGAATPLSELALPPLESRAGLELLHIVYCYCCAGAAGRGQWSEAEANAMEAGACLARLGGSAHGGLRASWGSFCHAHNALLCLLESGRDHETGGSGGWREMVCTSSGWVWRPNGTSAARSIAGVGNLETAAFEATRRLRDECARMCEPGCSTVDGLGVPSSLEALHGAVTMCWRLCGPMLAVDLLVVGLSAALRLRACRAAAAASGTGSSPPTKRPRSAVSLMPGNGTEAGIMVPGPNRDSVAAGIQGGWDTGGEWNTGGDPAPRVEPLLRALLGMPPAAGGGLSLEEEVWDAQEPDLLPQAGWGGAALAGTTGFFQIENTWGDATDMAEDGEAEAELAPLLVLVSLSGLLLGHLEPRARSPPGVAYPRGAPALSSTGAHLGTRDSLRRLIDELSALSPMRGGDGAFPSRAGGGGYSHGYEAGAGPCYSRQGRNGRLGRAFVILGSHLHARAIELWVGASALAAHPLSDAMGLADGSAASSAARQPGARGSQSPWREIVAQRRRMSSASHCAAPAVARALAAARAASARGVHLFERALALRERRVWTAGEEASGAAAAHLHALLLLLTGLSSAAAAALHRHCARHPPSAQAHALLAIVLSHRGQPQEAVQALHRALVLERGCGGTGAVRLLYNLVAVHDEHSQNDVALNMSDFLWEAAAEVHHAQDAGAAYQSAAGMGAAEASMALPYGGMTDAHPGLQGRSLTPTLVALHLDAIPSPAAPQQSAPPRKGLRESEAEAGRVRAAGEVETNPGFPPSNMREASNDCHARFRLFAAGGLSLPLARYVHARAQLLCGQWRPAADALRDLALSGPQCLASLSALGVDSTQLLSQASLAQLYDGAYDEVVQMLEQVGAADRPQLRMMYADALLGLERADDALGHLAIPTDQADEMHNDGDALLGGGVPAQAPHGSSVGAPALGPGGVYREEAPGAGGLASVDSDDAREEARWRNNRACLLMCAGQPDRAEAELRRCCQLCPEDLEHEFNLCLVLWKMGERREACDRWLRRRGYPIDATAATYCRLADAVRPTAAEAEGSRAEGHATGRLDDAQRAGLDRLALRYFEELKSVEEFPSCWWGGAGGSLTA